MTRYDVFKAIKKNDLTELKKLILNNKEFLNGSIRNRGSALWNIMQFGTFEAAKLLVEELKCDINMGVEDNSEDTPIKNCVVAFNNDRRKKDLSYKSRVKIFRYLLKQGADVSSVPIKDLADENVIIDDDDLFFKVIEKGYKVDPKDQWILFLACKTGKLKLVKYLVETFGISPIKCKYTESRSGSGDSISWHAYGKHKTALYAAVEGNYVEVVKYLLEKGVNPDKGYRYMIESDSSTDGNVTQYNCLDKATSKTIIELLEKYGGSRLNFY